MDPEVEERNLELHRTLVEYLVRSSQPEIAAAVLEGSVVTERPNGHNKDVFFIEIPVAAYPYVADSQEIQNILLNSLRDVVKGHWGVDNDPKVQFRMKRTPVPDEDWNREMKSWLTEFCNRERRGEDTKTVEKVLMIGSAVEK